MRTKIRNKRAETQARSADSAFGLSLGDIEGIGLAYRHFFSPDSAYHIALLPLITDTTAFASLGTEYIHVFHQTESIRYYTPIGASLFYLKNTNGDYSSSGCSNYSCTGYGFDSTPGSSVHLGLGGGIGVEFFGRGGFSFAAEVPLVLGLSLLNGIKFKYLLPVPSVLLLYYF